MATSVQQVLPEKICYNLLIQVCDWLRASHSGLWLAERQSVFCNKEQSGTRDSYISIYYIWYRTTDWLMMKDLTCYQWNIICEDLTPSDDPIKMDRKWTKPQISIMVQFIVTYHNGHLVSSEALIYTCSWEKSKSSELTSWHYSFICCHCCGITCAFRYYK